MTPFQIFETLNDLNIQYCNWKSNVFLDKSFNGRTDFDLLILKKDKSRFDKIVDDYQLIKRYPTSSNLYPGVEDYLGFDEKTGKMFHFHVHYQLIIGQKPLKNYRIPFERAILEASVLHDKYNIKVSSYEFEYAILLIRSVLKLKINVRTLLRILIKRKAFPENIAAEYKYLINNIKGSKLKNTCDTYFPEISELILKHFQIKKIQLSIAEIFQVKLKIHNYLHQYKRYTYFEHFKYGMIRNSGRKHQPAYLSQGGLSIAFIGVDGSGKSSMSELISNWIAWKLPVKKLYFGLPKKLKTYQLIVLLFRVISALRIKTISTFTRSLLHVWIARYRYLQFKKSKKYTNKGYIVIYDRFPDKSFWDFQDPMDGPRSSPSNFLGKFEYRYYNRIEPPDYKIILKVAIEDSILRKPEHADAIKTKQIENKINQIKRLIKDNDKSNILIDTKVGKSKTFAEIKKSVWDLL